MGLKKNAATVCEKALGMIRCEEEILRLEVDCPGRRSSGISSISPLFLADWVTASDLVEIVTPLFEIGFFKTEAGKAPLKTIIRQVEHMVNARIPNFHILRNAVLRRKKLTPFIDRLRQTWIDISQR